MTSSPTSQTDQRRDQDEHIGAGWRRGIAGAVTALAIAALIGPATAGANRSEIDENGNTTPVEPPICPGMPGCSVPVEPDDDSTIPNGSGSCSWTVRGHLVVRNPTVDGLADNDPIEGVEVKVSGKTVAYNEWGTDTTDSNGNFSVQKHVCGDRKVKVEARFDSGNLRVTSSKSPNWYLLRETDDKVAPSTIDLDDEPFGSPSPGESGDQVTSQARTDAQTWIVYDKALDYAASIFHSFLNKVTVHNPATLTTGDSWADPVLGDIHIAPRDTASIDTMLHEGGHAWAYPREIGEGCLIAGAISGETSHEFQEKPCVAFNEGFAEFFSNKIEQEMNADRLIASTEAPYVDGVIPPNASSPTTTPMDRAELNSRGLISLDRVARSDVGWEQVFNVLTSSDITRQLFGPGFGNGGLVSTYGPSCAGRGMPVGQDDLADALRAFGDSQDQLDLQDSEEPSVSDVLNRAADRLTTFDTSDSIAYLDAIDPTLESEPHDAYGC